MSFIIQQTDVIFMLEFGNDSGDKRGGELELSHQQIYCFACAIFRHKHKLKVTR
jgi:hypothetical protein